jgi:two-component system phosphate regulon sensor histidine kinase PhoR
MNQKTIHELMASLPDQVTHHIQHLERMRQDFVANVSHELRTPLTVIHGYIEALLSQNIDETKPWKKIFTQMHQQTLRMENLIDDLLLLSRLESHEEGSAPENSVDAAALLKTICYDAQEFSGELKHHIELNAHPALFLLGNTSELRSLFSNIIFNAVKYTPAKGHISIRWDGHPQQAIFSVQDTGIGIAAEHIPRITERFYRVDPARSRTSGGTGLGLAIAKHVLIRHQATLTIDSTLDKGSLFTCTFPENRIIKG